MTDSLDSHLCHNPEIDIDVDIVINRFAAQPAERYSTASANDLTIPKRRRLQL